MNGRRATACDSLGVAVVRALPASRAARLRRGRHPVGTERAQRQTTRRCALHQLRQQRCNTSAPRLGRQSYWLSTLSNPRRLPNGSRCAMTRMSPQPDTEEVLAGLVERVTYHNTENGFCVLRARARGHRDAVTVVGHAAVISAGEWIMASGQWVNDRTHGQQFKARFLRTSAPTSAEGIEKYLSSGMIRGVTRERASWRRRVPRTCGHGEIK